MIALASWLGWFKDLTGAWNPSGPTYNLWSGFIPCMALLSFAGGAIAHFRHVNCHIKGCWRVSRHDYEMKGATYRLCRVHHPAVDEGARPSAADFAAHHAAKAAQ